MTNYLIRRGAQMFLVVLISTVALFALLNSVPGGPKDQIPPPDPKNGLTQADIDRLERSLGLHRPFTINYIAWLAGEDWFNEVGWAEYQTTFCEGANGHNGNVAEGRKLPCQEGLLRGDLGVSWALANQQPVSKVIGSRLSNTVILMGSTLVLSLLIAVPIGVIAAVRQYSKLDYTVTTISFFGIAMPSFWFGLLLIIFFGVMFQRWGLPAFPTGDVVTMRVVPGTIQDFLSIEPRSLADRILHLILPVTMLSLGYVAGWSRFLRGQMLEVLRQDYIRVARAKGLQEWVVIAKHGVRNALIPLITIISTQLPTIFGGAIITETIFNYPGMGRLFFDALSRNDWPIVMALLFISSLLVVFGTLIGDILYTIIDPRIRFEQANNQTLCLFP